MLVEPLNNKKIKIQLSNTESVTQNIFKYTSIDKIKETKSTSSTSNYFITTKEEIAKQVMELLNDDSKPYILDVNNLKEIVIKENKLINKLNLKNDFKGNLKPFYESIGKLENIKNKELTLGEALVRLDGGGKYNIYFDNSNENVELFRNSILAILIDINIEIKSDYYLVYLTLKENIDEEELLKYDETQNNSNQYKINETENKYEIKEEPSIFQNDNIENILLLSKELTINENKAEILKKIILECYSALNKFDNIEKTKYSYSGFINIAVKKELYQTDIINKFSKYNFKRTHTLGYEINNYTFDATAWELENENINIEELLNELFETFHNDIIVLENKTNKIYFYNNEKKSKDSKDWILYNIQSFIDENYNLSVVNNEKFVGCKIDINDKYYILYVTKKDEKSYELYYRNDKNEMEKSQKLLHFYDNEFSDKYKNEIRNILDSILVKHQDKNLKIEKNKNIFEKKLYDFFKIKK